METNQFLKRRRINRLAWRRRRPALIGTDYFREIAAIVNAGGPPDPENIKAVMTRHGLVPALPPTGA
jgi:hypothetical protein